MSDIAHEGGCACGAVRYRATGDPINVNNCYCTQCQCQTGSTSVVNAFFEADRLTLLAGDVSESVFRAGSGNPHVVVRCASCGTALRSHYPRFGRLGAGVRVSTFDDSATFRPIAAIFVAERMPWVTLPEGIPAFEAYYDPQTLLPPASLARMAALMARKADETLA